MTSKQETCQTCRKNFTIDSEDLGFYEKVSVPPPTWCPDCRLLRRLAWVGYRILYKRKCDFTGDMVISVHHPDDPRKIYRQDIWWSDKWDPKEYGREYDFSRPFFSQWKELLDEIPLPALYTEYTTMVHSDYCNAAAELKNCYLCFKADYSENCGYLNTITEMKDCYDMSFANNCELSYDSVVVDKCYGVISSKDCHDCHSIWFSEDLAGCSDCIGCIGLRKKKYHIFNKAYSKEEYEKKLKEYNFGSRKNNARFKEEFSAFSKTWPHKEFHGYNITNSSGDYLHNCKNVQDSFMVGNGENLRYCQLLKNGPAAESYDYTMFGMNAERVYESAWVGLSAKDVKFGMWDYKCHDIEYSFGCHGSGNLFGCIGIRMGEYCILNRQYSKDEYWELMGRIKKHMEEVPYKDKFGREHRYGEYFPIEFCLWAYNESNAMEWFPKTKGEAVKEGFAWRDDDEREYQEATMEAPDDIRDVKDDILDAVLACRMCRKNYLIIKPELEFYRRMEVPVPDICPLCRDRERIARLNPMTFYARTCAKCGKDIRTSYAPERPEIVYCEECYQQEIV